MNARLAALKILSEVIIRQKNLSFLLEHVDMSENTSLIKEICYGVCRYYYRLKFIISKLIAKPLKAQDQDIEILILIGLYQLIYLRTPDHAAVMETVSAAKTIKKIWASKLINGVLRNFIRQKQQLLTQADQNVLAKYSYPEWFIQKIQQTYPLHWQQILLAGNNYPPMSLRINQQKITRDEFIKKYGVVGTLFAYNQCGLILEEAVSVEKLPGFLQGEVSVQDCAAQIAAKLLCLQPNLRVLDACAAPGGKTAHILECEPRLKDLIAVEIDPERAKKIQDTLSRLNVSAEIIINDAANPEKWWDGQEFDRILLDAPCTATGIIRRHPDIKLLRAEKDITRVIKLQQQLLNKLWPLLKPGGLFLYVTCSILTEENYQNISIFLKKHADAAEEPINAAWGGVQQFGRQILPEDNIDGFYYCCLRKIKG